MYDPLCVINAKFTCLINDFIYSRCTILEYHHDSDNFDHQSFCQVELVQSSR